MEGIYESSTSKIKTNNQISGTRTTVNFLNGGRPWYSFNHARWSNKISAYQYRDPSEEFAETYASYHVAPMNQDSKGRAYKKGDRTPADLRAWFEKEGLHREKPEDVKGTSEMSGKEKRAS